MKTKFGVALDLIGRTTFGPLLLGYCAVLVGLGIGDQPFLRQVAGFAGALLLALASHRSFASIRLPGAAPDADPVVAEGKGVPIE